jgi:hypothetical protein
MSRIGRLGLFAGLCFVTSGMIAQEKALMVHAREGNVNWAAEAASEKLFHGLNEITIANDWQLIAMRVALADAAINSKTLDAALVKQVKLSKIKLLNIELTLLNGALADTERIKRDAFSEEERSRRISEQKKAVYKALSEAQQQL